MHRNKLFAKHSLSEALDVFWPRRSLVSGVPAKGALNAEDFAALSFISGPVCNQCGRPMELDLGPEAICAPCTARPPPWQQARAALVYDDVSRIPILALKRAGRRDGLKVMANWMSSAGAPFLSSVDLIIPVPLHYFRLINRGYNQSGWLANAIGKQNALQVEHRALLRHRATKSQASLTARARHKNVAGAFRVREKKVPTIAGKHVLLIDDVYTTGATLKAASKALRKAGATQISVLVLARVVREENIVI